MDSLLPSQYRNPHAIKATTVVFQPTRPVHATGGGSADPLSISVAPVETEALGLGRRVISPQWSHSYAHFGWNRNANGASAHTIRGSGEGVNGVMIVRIYWDAGGRRRKGGNNATTIRGVEPQSRNKSGGLKMKKRENGLGEEG